MNPRKKCRDKPNIYFVNYDSTLSHNSREKPQQPLLVPEAELVIRLYLTCIKRLTFQHFLFLFFFFLIVQ